MKYSLTWFAVFALAAVIQGCEGTGGNGQRQKGGELEKSTTNSIGMKFVLIPAGEFMMGSSESPEETAKAFGSFPKAYRQEGPQHRVRITKPFQMGVFEVTQAQYEKVTGSGPSFFKGDANRPVESVSWDSAVQFCQKLSALPEEKAAGAVYRLPTEAEWEYACRAGTTTRFSFGDDPERLEDFAWRDRNSRSSTHPVGQKKPNPWGLYDVLGNVSEWCADQYDADYYAKSPVDDPRGPGAGEAYVLRGGSYLDGAAVSFRCAYRYPCRSNLGERTIGFRVVRTLAP